MIAGDASAIGLGTSSAVGHPLRRAMPELHGFHNADGDDRRIRKRSRQSKVIFKRNPVGSPEENQGTITFGDGR
ncbi:MAG: hypothetical protein ACU0DH_06460 [Paracoccus sp. (in: a-proteobacteria)]|uniref:hypothetical protein n=1 Tax=Paracoccus sp. TaxID=267 RepID=UPI004058C0BA